MANGAVGAALSTLGRRISTGGPALLGALEKREVEKRRLAREQQQRQLEANILSQAFQPTGQALITDPSKPTTLEGKISTLQGRIDKEQTELETLTTSIDNAERGLLQGGITTPSEGFETGIGKLRKSQDFKIKKIGRLQKEQDRLVKKQEKESDIAQTTERRERVSGIVNSALSGATDAGGAIDTKKALLSVLRNPESSKVTEQQRNNMRAEVTAFSKMENDRLRSRAADRTSKLDILRETRQQLNSLRLLSAAVDQNKVKLFRKESPEEAAIAFSFFGFKIARKLDERNADRFVKDREAKNILRNTINRLNDSVLQQSESLNILQRGDGGGQLNGRQGNRELLSAGVPQDLIPQTKSLIAQFPDKRDSILQQIRQNSNVPGIMKLIEDSLRQAR